MSDAVFPIYYEQVACAGMKQEDASGRFALATTIGMVLIAVISPLLGTIADFNGGEKRETAGVLTLRVAAVAGVFFFFTPGVIPASGVVFLVYNWVNGRRVVFY